MRKISVIIPLFEYAGIDEVLASLFRSTGCVFEVVVIDNSERPERVRLMAEKIARFPQVRYCRQKRNLGVTGGRNAGFAAADAASDYILFLDHDVSVRDDCLKNLAEDFIDPTILDPEPDVTTPSDGIDRDTQEPAASGN